VRLAEAVSRLRPFGREIYSGTQDGKTLRQLAIELGVCYRTVKRRWREVIAELRKELAPFFDQEPVSK